MKKSIFAIFAVLITTIAYADDAVTCFDDATGRGLSSDQKIRLCAGSKSNEQVVCFDRASGRGLSSDQKIDLCKVFQPACN